MKTRALLFSVIAFFALTLLTVSAAPGTRIYGPFPSSTPDSGTCGNDWADDTFDRFFRVSTSPNADGTYNVEEQFKNGSFVTVAGQSPGACETNPGGTVTAGIRGGFQGSFSIVVTGGTYNPDADCSTGPGCGTTADFVHTVFGAEASFSVTTFLFNYNSSDQGLTRRTWKNASLDRGGNKGDIAN